MSIFKKILGVLAILFVLGIIVSIPMLGLGRARLKGYPAPFAPEEIAIKTPLAPSGIERQMAGDFEVREIATEPASRLVIRTGTLNIVVENVEDSVNRISQYTKDKNGWVVGSSIYEWEKIPTGSITVRVPSENFNEAIAYFRGLAEKVIYEGIQGQDVTEEYVDLQSRLRNLKATETELLKIMKRSGTISEVLNVQRELTKVQGEIEQTKGRIQYLEKSAEMATITVHLALSEELLPIPLAEKWRPIYVIRRAWASALGALQGISYLLIWLGIYGITWIPLIAIIWQVRKFWKKRKQVSRSA